MPTVSQPSRGLWRRISSHTFMPLPGTPLASAPPGRVTPEVESILGRLSKDGFHISQWRKQEELAATICR